MVRVPPGLFRIVVQGEPKCPGLSPVIAADQRGIPIGGPQGIVDDRQENPRLDLGFDLDRPSVHL